MIRAALWFGLMGAPVAWCLQELINVSLAGQACSVQGMPLPMATFEHLMGLLFIVEAVALVVCTGAGFVAYVSWRRTRPEMPGDAHQLLGGGDGRTRFLAIAGILTSILFALATALAALNLTAISSCGG